ncbi:trans-sialidase, putative, partial [Trypanosoma cruzi]
WMGGGDYCFTPFSSSLFLTHKEGKQALIATVEFEGSERTNSTHRPHTHIYMLSRVAVMAPRTHNRRRVTGSRGRRREGRESEPQRPNMYRRVFTSALLLLVMMMCCCSAAASSSESSKRNLFVWRDMTSEGTVGFLFSPSLVEVDGGVFAVAGAQYTKGAEIGLTGIASELLTWADEQTSKELDTTKLETQLLVECPAGNENCVSQAVDETDSESETRIHVSRPTTVVHGSNIYMIAGMYNLDGASTGEDITDEWGLLVAVGNVSSNNDNGRNKDLLD